MNFPRWVFRLQHRLAMTHNEFLALTVAAALFVGGELARQVFRRGPVFEPDYYSRQDSLFFALALRDSTLDATGVRAADSLAVPDTLLAHRDTSYEDDGSPVEGRVNVNEATLVELTTLPGIGPRLAERIIDYRNRNGPFRRVADLERVSGIGPRKLEILRPLVVVEF